MCVANPGAQSVESAVGVGVEDRRTFHVASLAGTLIPGGRVVYPPTMWPRALLASQNSLTSCQHFQILRCPSECVEPSRNRCSSEKVTSTSLSVLLQVIDRHQCFVTSATQPLPPNHQLSTMNDLYDLELLSLIARITQEIYNYIAVNDKVLAEYVLSLHEQSSTLNDFKDKLNGALPDSAIENIDRLILNLHPKHKKKSKELANILAGSNVDANGQIETDKQKRLFPGLSLPDQESNKDVLMQEVDDMMAQFEGAAKKKARVEKTEESPALAQRSRSRSRSPPRRRSRSPERGRSYDGRRDYRHGGRDRVSNDERPVLFKIYNGRISGLKDFGAFVQLEGIAGRVEGRHFL